MTSTRRRDAAFISPVSVLSAAFVMLGVGIRLIEFGHRRSLWNDEAMFALNIATRSFTELLRPLDLLQVAPAGFLWLEKLVTVWGGVGEWQLRVIPLIAGIVVVIVIVPVARVLAGQRTAFLSVGLVAASSFLIYFSNEAKPYEIDAAATLLILGAALWWRRQHSRRAIFTLATVGLLSPWVALASVFSLAGVGLWLCWEAVISRQRVLMIVIMLWTLSIAAAQWWIRSITSATNLEDIFWSGSQGLSLVRPPFSVMRGIINNGVFGWMGRPTSALLTTAIVAVMIAGCFAIARHNDKRVAMAVSAPILLALAAGVFGPYPVSQRLWTFAAPLMTVLFAAGVIAVVDHLRLPRGRDVSILVGLLILAPGFRRSFYNPAPILREEARPVFAEYARRRSLGEPTYVFARSVPAWLFYSTDWGQADYRQTRHVMRLASPGQPSWMNSIRSGVWAPRDTWPPDFPGTVGMVLTGLASGYHIAEQADLNARPDPAWASAEVSRISSATTRCAWLFTAHALWPEQQLLLDSLGAHGFTRRDEIAAVGASAERVCRS